MLGSIRKLLRYEFRYYARLLPPFYLVLAFLAIPAGIQMRQTLVSGIVLTSIWGVLMTAMIVMNIVIIIQRFTNNLFKNPGYLMHTLPVTAWAHTASKAAAALCMALISIVVITVSGIAFAAGMVGWEAIFANASIDVTNSIIGTVVLIIMIAQQLCLIYAAISASHILPRFRSAAGVILYFAVMYAVEWPVFRLLWPLTVRTGAFIGDTPGSFVNLIPYGIAGLVFTALFFWAAGFLLKHKVNLE